jgi:DNA-binding transcriptional LysR family regulator
MIVIRVGWFRGVICASPAHLAIRDMPDKPADLAPTIAWRRSGRRDGRDNWEFASEGRREVVAAPCRLILNSAEAAMSAAIAGAGVVRALSRSAKTNASWVQTSPPRLRRSRLLQQVSANCGR